MVMGEFTQDIDVLVIGGGPGGYAAAFRAADLGREVAMVEMEARPGGVCLFRGCIPSKTLLYVTELIHDARRAEGMGITFSEPEIRLEELRRFKDGAIDKLAGGLVNLCRSRKVQFIKGRAVFESARSVRLLDTDAEVSHIRFKHAIIATGSVPIPLPGTGFRPGGLLMSSTEALELKDIPEKLLVVGGGYVGLELGSVYAALGSRVTLVEMADGLLPGVDRDLVRPLAKNLEAQLAAIHLHTRVEHLEETEKQVKVILEGEAPEREQTFDRVLVAIGRRPFSGELGLENTGVKMDEKGFIQVDERMRTHEERIFAIGDVVGGVMLAHKAMYEGKIAAEVIAGEPAVFDARAIPAVVYTDPQIAWCGLTETEARQENRPIQVSRYPWSASGRAASMGLSQGSTKVILDPETERILGMGIVGREAGEMIGEGVLAVEMGALAEDLALSVHPHPTLVEGEEEAAAAFLGSSTHILPQRKKPARKEKTDE